MPFLFSRLDFFLLLQVVGRESLNKNMEVLFELSDLFWVTCLKLV